MMMMNEQMWVDGLRTSSHEHLDVAGLVFVAFFCRLLRGEEPRLPDLLLEHGEISFQLDVAVQGPPLARPALNVFAALITAD